MNKETESGKTVPELLQDYVTRLSAGEELASVRADFVAHFQSVDASDIAQAEQALLQSGTKLSDVQRLCDVHSALFHGTTRQEQPDAAAPAGLPESPGHPANVFMAENGIVAALADAVQRALRENAGREALAAAAGALRGAAVHYARKGDLIYPLLDRTYGVSGPANVMWGVDDEIRDELKRLAEDGDSLPDYRERLDKVSVRVTEMVYKENNILFPLCLRYFSEEDWMRIYDELSAYETLLPGGYPVWDAAERRRAGLRKPDGSAQTRGDAADTVPLGHGGMTPEQLRAVLDTIPMELTFVDVDNVNRFFNGGEKLFKRPEMALGREVFSCHPPKYQAMVRGILDSFRAGTRDHVDVWAEKGGEPVSVRYLAVRDGAGRYLGTLECVQRMGFARTHFAGGEDGEAR